MKKVIRITLATLLLYTAPFYAQEYPGAPVPDFYPTSPEAASLGAYGNIDRALQSGNMSFSVPVHTFQMGSYSWPIALNYSYGGLLLEGKPSITGLGWNLAGVGAVRREVRGLPDEHPEGYYGPRDRGARIKDYMNGTDFSLSELRKYLNGEWDKEVDIYHVQAGPVSFSYKKDEYGNPVYLSQHNHKVSYNDQEITVTDDNGIIYTFADTENNEPSDASPNTAFEYTITWNLSEIKYPNGRTLTFNYIDDQYLSYDFYASGSVRYFPNGLQDGTGGTGPTYGTGTYQDGVNQSVIKRKILKSITSSDATLLTFSITEIPGRKLYDGISVSKQSNIDAFTFSYDGARDMLTQVTKDGQLLFGFEYYDQNDMPGFIDNINDRARAQDDWRFYNAAANAAALNVPSSSYQANKAPNFVATRKGAMKKIIYPTGGYSMIDYEQNQINEVYNQPSSNNTNPYANVSFNRQILLKLQSDNSASAPEVKTSTFTKTFDQPVVATISSAIRGTLQSSHLTMSISRTSTCPANINPITGEEEVTVNPISDDYYVNAAHFRSILNESIPQMCPTLGEEFGPDNDDPGYYTFSHTSGGRIVIKPGTYTFRISNDYNRSSDAYGEIKVRFYEPPASGTIVGSEINVDVGGIRVEKIQHYTDNNSISKTQYFDYATELGGSSGLLLNKFEEVPFNVVTYTPSPFVDSNQPIRTEYTDIAYRLNRFNSLTVNQSAPVYYTHIKEYDSFILEEVTDSDNDADLPPIFDPLTNEDGTLVYSEIGNTSSSTNYIRKYPNGYKLTVFEAPAQNYDFEHPNYPQNQDLDKGRVKLSVAYKGGDETSKVQQSETQYKQFRGLVDQDYQDYNNDHPWSLKIVQKLNIVADCTIPGACDLSPIPSQEHYQIDRYIIKPYREVLTRYKPLTSVSTSYFNKDGVQQIVTNTSTNLYNSNYAIAETTVTDSHGDQIRTVLKYPYNNLTDFTDLSTEASNTITALKSANRISTPIQTEAYKKEGNTETLLYTQRTDYKSWGDNISGDVIYAPETTWIAKRNDDLEKRLSYFGYDAYGNPISVAQEDGTHIYYIWGYQGQQPIAKITNFTMAQAANIQSLIDDAIAAADADFNRPTGTSGTEAALREALEDIRTDPQLENAQMSYYTYDPMIGVTSMTDLRGYTMYYEYDALNRLIAVKDADGNLVSENKYNYKN